MWVLLITGLIRKRTLFTIILAAVVVLSTIPILTNGTSGIHFLISRSMRLAPYFAIGALLYHWRSVVPVHPAIFIVSVITATICLVSNTPQILLPLSLTYATIYLGSLCLPRFEADYSYGTYLFGFPIQQAVVDIFPWSHEWWINFLISYPIIVCCAVFSWHFVEAPMLALKRRRMMPARVRLLTVRRRLD